MTCDGCKFYLPSLIYTTACYRPKRFKSGKVIKTIPGSGFPIEFETSEAAHYDDRADGDACGPDRSKWVAA